MSRRAGFGLAIIVVVIVGLVLAAVLAGQAYLASGSASQLTRLSRAEEARVLAESALEEGLMLISRDANGATGPTGDTYVKFRSNIPKGFTLEVPLAKLSVFNQELAKHPLCQAPPPEVAAHVRFAEPLDRSANPFHDQRFGTLELTASVSYQLDRAVERRAITRWFELKIVHTTLPFPFDRTLVYVHNALKVVNLNAQVQTDDPMRANLLIHDAADTLDSAPRTLDALAQRIQGSLNAFQRFTTSGRATAIAKLQAALSLVENGRASARTAQARYEASVAKILLLQSDNIAPFLFGFPLMAYVQADKASPRGLELAKYNLPVFNRKFTDERRTSKSAVQAERARENSAFDNVESIALDEPPAGGPDIEATCRAIVAACSKDVETASTVLETYKDFQTQFDVQSGDDALKDFNNHLDQIHERVWTNSDSGAAATDPVLLPGKAQFAIPKARCQDAADMSKALGEILDRYGPPFQGTIHVDNAGGAELVLDGDADVRWRGFAGRLTLVSSGACRVKNVSRAIAAQHLITIVCNGQLIATGHVEASLVAFGRFIHPGGELTILGHLILDQPAHELGVDADVEQVLDGIVMLPDPMQPTNVEPNTVKGDRVAVLIAPAPIYSRAPRQEER